MRRLHLVSLIALIRSWASAPSIGAGPGSSLRRGARLRGVPQIGAVVQLLRPDMTVICRRLYRQQGHLHFRYDRFAGQLCREGDGRSRFCLAVARTCGFARNTVVNLTLNTLYEVMQWLPAEPRAANAQKDDWEWTLRSAANRPLLRWLEDGPLVVVSDRPAARPKLKARLMATGARKAPSARAASDLPPALKTRLQTAASLLARVDFAPDTDAGMESMLGFRQDLGFAGSVESLAAISIHPVDRRTGRRRGSTKRRCAAAETHESWR